MPIPTLEQLHALALTHLSAEYPQFGPLAILIVSAILSSVISHLIQKCLDHVDPVSLRSPGVFKRWQLRRLVRSLCSDPAVLAQARAAGLDASGTDKAYGDTVYAALLATAKGLSETEAVGLCGGA